MREIKFKTYKKSNGCVEYCTLKELANKDTFDINFDDYEWVQYTGLKDENGKEIYEGDMVHAESGESYYGAREYVDTITVENFIGDTYKLGHYENLLVIGNIYENLELLEAK